MEIIIFHGIGFVMAQRRRRKRRESDKTIYVEDGQKGNTHEDIPGVDRRKRRGRYGAERINNKRK